MRFLCVVFLLHNRISYLYIYLAWFIFLAFYSNDQSVCVLYAVFKNKNTQNILKSAKIFLYSLPKRMKRDSEM